MCIQDHHVAEIPCLRPLRSDDREHWQVIATNSRLRLGRVLPLSAYDLAWQRLMEETAVFGLGAYMSGELVGIAHCVIHANVWSHVSCYLENLFVHESWRRRGVGRALIHAIAKRASQLGAGKFYWMTEENNVAARGLYDTIAVHRGLTRYDYDLPATDPSRQAIERRAGIADAT